MIVGLVLRVVVVSRVGATAAREHGARVRLERGGGGRGRVVQVGLMDEVDPRRQDVQEKDEETKESVARHRQLPPLS